MPPGGDPVILERRFQKLPRYAYCTSETCEWTDSAGVNPEPEAIAHLNATGHQVRVVISQQIILDGIADRPAMTP